MVPPNDQVHLQRDRPRFRRRRDLSRLPQVPCHDSVRRRAAACARGRAGAGAGVGVSVGDEVVCLVDGHVGDGPAHFVDHFEAQRAVAGGAEGGSGQREGGRVEVSDENEERMCFVSKKQYFKRMCGWWVVGGGRWAVCGVRCAVCGVRWVVGGTCSCPLSEWRPPETLAAAPPRPDRYRGEKKNGR